MRVWRIDRKAPKNIYVDDVDVGRIDDPDLAAEIVAAMNLYEAILQDAIALQTDAQLALPDSEVW